jgi:hypothetical protein
LDFGKKGPNSPLWRGALQGGVVLVAYRLVANSKFPETTPSSFAVHPSIEGNFGWSSAENSPLCRGDLQGGVVLESRQLVGICRNSLSIPGPSSRVNERKGVGDY